MTRRLAATLVTLTISACLIGCASGVKFPAYYTLHVPPATTANDGRSPRIPCGM